MTVPTTPLSAPADGSAPMTMAPPKGRRSVAPGEALGFVFPMLLVWLCFEFGRPPNAFKIPMLVSLIAFGTWVVRKDKQWAPQSWCFIVILGIMVLGIPFAANNYWAFWTTKILVILFLCIILPLQSLLTTVRRVRLWVNTFIAISVYVSLWAVFHRGYGPSGAGGAQDENYVSALISMALPFVYFSLFLEKRVFPRILLALSVCVFCGAMAVQLNPSRGGFLAVCAIVIYCLWRSPRKLLGFGIVAVGVITVAALAGPAYWAEISTSADYKTGTADMRLDLWLIGLRMFQAHPLLGVGAGNFQRVAGDYQSAAQLEKLGRNLSGTVVTHSLPVELLAELGGIAFVALAILVWRTWVDLGRIQPQGAQSSGSAPVSRDVTAIRCYADATRAALLGISVSGVFLSLLYFSNLYLLIAVGCAIPHVYRRLPGTQQSGIEQRRSPRGAPVTRRTSRALS